MDGPPTWAEGPGAGTDWPRLGLMGPGERMPDPSVKKETMKVVAAIRRVIPRVSPAHHPGRRARARASRKSPELQLDTANLLTKGQMPPFELDHGSVMPRGRRS